MRKTILISILFTLPFLSKAQTKKYVNEIEPQFVIHSHKAKEKELIKLDSLKVDTIPQKEFEYYRVKGEDTYLIYVRKKQPPKK